ncbi:MAG: SWIM zinc finger family protein [Anaerolineae bacterium]
MSDWWYDDDDDYYEEDDYTLSDYDTPIDALKIAGPVRAVSRRGDIGQEWWGRQWVEALEHMGLDGRLQRGKRYARNGSVQMLEISHGKVYAQVKGSQPRPYRTSINLKQLSDEQWQQALDALSEQAIYVAKLLAGEMPGDIEGVFQHIGLSLFPRNQRDIDFVCSCPDWGDPCKHAAAVYYLVAEQLDNDPFILFHIRGRKRDTILKGLHQYDVEETQADTSVCYTLEVDNFWEAESSALVRHVPIQMDEPFALRQLGKPPAPIEKELYQLYRHISTEARRWLGLNP